MFSHGLKDSIYPRPKDASCSVQLMSHVLKKASYDGVQLQ